jgi:cell division GTPase FtsZ
MLFLTAAGMGGGTGTGAGAGGGPRWRSEMGILTVGGGDEAVRASRASGAHRPVPAGKPLAELR